MSVSYIFTHEKNGKADRENEVLICPDSRSSEQHVHIQPYHDFPEKDGVRE